MNYTAQVAQPVGDIVTILKDLLPRRDPVKAKEVGQAVGTRKQVGGVSSLGCFGNEE